MSSNQRAWQFSRKSNRNSNDSTNPNAASSSSTASSNRWNRNNRGYRNGPSSSNTVHSVNSVVPSDDDGWGEPNPRYWEKKERQEERKRREREFRAREREEHRSHMVGQAASFPVGREGWGEPSRQVGQGRPLAEGSIAQGANWYSDDIEPQADWGYAHSGKYDEYGRIRDRRDCSSLIEAQSSSGIALPREFNRLSVDDTEFGMDDGNSSRDSGVAETDESIRSDRSVPMRIFDKENEGDKQDERTALSILKVYSNDLLMENIISHITQLSERSRVEMASARMFNLSKRAPYLFERGGDHLHIHFTTFDDFATIEYGSVVRTVPILTMDTRRFDKMESRMTIALHRILGNISARFAKNVRKITLGGTTEFYSARGVPDHHLIITYDLVKYLLETFECVSSLHLINCGFDDGAIDICDSPLWKKAMLRMESMELRTVWADTPSRLPEILTSFSRKLEYFTLTRFTCKRMGAALMEQLRRADCRLKEIQLLIDEDSAEDDMEMFCMLKELASRTESIRITVPEIGDGTKPSPKCFRILSKLRDIPNLTELKFYVLPKTGEQMRAMIGLFRDFEFLTSLRTVHIQGFVDHQWMTNEMIYDLADAFKTGMNYLAPTLEDVSFANFPKPTKANSNGYKGDRKEAAFMCLWNSMASSIGSRSTKRLTLASVRMTDDHLRRIYNKINAVVEEVYLKHIRGVTPKSVIPLVNGEFPMLQRLEAEIAVDPLIVSSNIDRTPLIQYAKFALKHRISNEDHHMKSLKAVFSGVFVDQESPRGPLKQFVEMHHRIPGAKAPTKEIDMQASSHNRRGMDRVARTTDYRCEGQERRPTMRMRRQTPKLLYGEWDD